MLEDGGCAAQTHTNTKSSAHALSVQRNNPGPLNARHLAAIQSERSVRDKSYVECVAALQTTAVIHTTQ